jgi:hypothetical protein
MLCDSLPVVRWLCKNIFLAAIFDLYTKRKLKQEQYIIVKIAFHNIQYRSHCYVFHKMILMQRFTKLAYSVKENFVK